MKLRWVITLLALAVLSLQPPARAVEPLPTALSDEQFWSLVSSLSEPGGTFRSENLASNEMYFVQMTRFTNPMKKHDGAYIGVGPEQNFHYIASLQPQIAFIVDIRRENRNLQLMYKALFELSTDRADFVARLFSRPRPDGLSPASSVDEIFASIAQVASSASIFEDNLTAIRGQLLVTHGFPLDQRDLDWIEHVYGAFHSDGPMINFWRSPARAEMSYVSLMTAKEVDGGPRSYLESEASFNEVKKLQTKNLIVPIVGDFAGTKALRAVGDYIRDHGAVVRVFYGSNVAENLTNNQRAVLCRNLASLPTDATSVHIGGEGGQRFSRMLGDCGPSNP